jgi:hypothetical protein
MDNHVEQKTPDASGTCAGPHRLVYQGIGIYNLRCAYNGASRHLIQE